MLAIAIHPDFIGTQKLAVLELLAIAAARAC